MPRPTRQLTVRLPWPVWARLCALAAADPHGARPGRVAATAVAAGLDVLEGGEGVTGAPTGRLEAAVARPVAQALRAAGLDAKARVGVVTVTALSAPEADALTAENDRRWPGALPDPGPAWHPLPGDPRWALGGMGGPYACESHVVAVEHGGRRVEVAVAAGDTVAVVRQAIAAAWQASEGRGTMAAERGEAGR